jgi:hypothetical protein
MAGQVRQVLFLGQPQITQVVVAAVLELHEARAAQEAAEMEGLLELLGRLEQPILAVALVAVLTTEGLVQTAAQAL